MSVLTHPFFLAGVDRGTAERMVSYNRWPILRTSSVEGRYAATYYCRKRFRIVHTLIRQNADNSVEDISPEGVVWGHYRTLDEFVSILVHGAPPLLTQIAPALVPLLPAVIARPVVSGHAEEDPN
jgi:hypothetical protein